MGSKGSLLPGTLSHFVASSALTVTNSCVQRSDAHPPCNCVTQPQRHGGHARQEMPRSHDFKMTNRPHGAHIIESSCHTKTTRTSWAGNSSPAAPIRSPDSIATANARLVPKITAVMPSAARSRKSSSNSASPQATISARRCRCMASPV